MASVHMCRHVRRHVRTHVHRHVYIANGIYACDCACAHPRGGSEIGWNRTDACGLQELQQQLDAMQQQRAAELTEIALMTSQLASSKVNAKCRRCHTESSIE